MKKFSFGLVWQSLKQSFKAFSEDKITKLSASLAYYTIFSIGPLLFVLIFVAGMVFGKEAVQGDVVKQLDDFIGSKAAGQVQDIIRSVSLSGEGMLATVIGVVTLLIGATGVFAEIQDSINSIWGLKTKPEAGIMQTIKNRLLSFGLIGSLGFLLLVSLTITAVVAGIGDKLQSMFPNLGVVMINIVNTVLSVGITSLLFGVIFKVLPDAKIGWKEVLPGAIFTSVLFLLGKFLISMYISKSDVGTTFGAAGSLVILLLWIYYSSIILYFGAEFTMYYALNCGAAIVPEKYAEWSHKHSVVGALPSSFKSRQEAVENSPEKKYSREPHWTFASDGPVKQDVKQKNNGPGLGTTLMGLALYFIKK